MEPGWRALTVLLPAVLGCQRGPIFSAPALPSDRSGSLLLLQLEAEETRSVQALSPPRPGAEPVLLELAESEQGEVWLLDEACDLGTLGLEPGVQVTSACEDACDPALLPPARTIWRSALVGDALSAWAPAERLELEAANALARLPVPAEHSACRLRQPAFRHEVEQRPVVGAPGLADFDGAAELPDGTLMMALAFFEDVGLQVRNGQGVYVVRPGSRRAEALPGLDVERYLTMFGWGEEVFVYGCGAIVKILADGSSTTAAVLPDAECSRAALTGAPAEQPFELFLASADSNLTLHHVTASGAERLYSAPRRSPNVPRVSVAWVAPGEGYAAGLAEGQRVLHASQGQAELEAVPFRGNPLAVGFVPGVGPVAGSDEGELAVRGPEGWTLLDRPFGEAVRDIVPIGPGGLALGCSLQGCKPQVSLFDAEGTCGADLLTTFYASHLLALRNGSVLAIAGGEAVGNLQIIRLHREREAFDCARKDATLPLTEH